MAVFTYKALDQNELTVRGTVTADTPRAARDLLRARGLLVQFLNEHHRAISGRWWLPRISSRSASHWAMAAHELSMLLHAGIPLLDALDTVADQHRGKFRTTILSVRDRVAAGTSFAEALAERPEVFDPLSIHLVEVGESSGTLELVLEQLADFKQRLMHLKDQVFTALMYPVFLLVFGTAATVFLMTYVMPSLLENLQESVDKLPWPTRVVKGGSDFLLGYGWLAALGAVVVVVAVAIALKTTTGRRLWHRTLLKLPLIGTMALKQGISRTALIISTLIRSGVVLTKALQLAARSTSNLVLREALEECGKGVHAGQDVATALGRSGVFPPLALRIFSVGQESGRLEEMLARLASDYDRQVATTSARMAALIEPVMIIIMAVFVGFVLLATILPILEAGNVL